jgi:hypothetical protein
MSCLHFAHRPIDPSRWSGAVSRDPQCGQAILIGMAPLPRIVVANRSAGSWQALNYDSWGQPCHPLDASTQERGHTRPVLLSGISHLDVPETAAESECRP